MSYFNCNICDFTTDIKCNYNRHNLTQKHILNVKHKKSINSSQLTSANVSLLMLADNNLEKSLANNNTGYKCSKCGELFKHRSSMSRHKKQRCNIITTTLDSNNDNMDIIIEDQVHVEKMYTIQEVIDMIKPCMNKENGIQELIIDLQHDKIQQLSNNIQSLNNNVINSNNVNNSINNVNNNVSQNINQNIVVNAYGKENETYITDEMKIKLCKRPKDMIPQYIKKLHFDVEHPENHNIKIPNKKEPFVMIKHLGGWRNLEKNDALGDLIEEKYNSIVEFFEEKEKNDPQFIKDNMLCDEINTFKEFVSAYDDERGPNKINNPSKQPTYNNVKEKCLCIMIEGKEDIKEAKQSAKNN